jgi:hypothetical protein
MARKLLDQVREVIQLKHYSRKTAKTYAAWIRRFILFHHKRHPREMGRAEIEAYLTYLAQERSVAAACSFSWQPRPLYNAARGIRGIASQRICWGRGTTSVRCRSSWATRT